MLVYKRRKIFPIVISVIICLILLAAIALYLTYNYQINKSFNNPSTLFTIEQGDSLQKVISNLDSKKIIDNPIIFTLYLRFSGLDKSIEAGSYSIPANASIIKLAKLFQNGTEFTTITIPEGLRLEEQADTIDNKLSQNNPLKKFDKQEFITLAKNRNNFSYSFLNTIPNQNPLEGYLFPDTYEVSKDANAKDVINTMLQNFNTKIYTKYNTSNTLTFYQAITLASILEREAKTPTDKKLIADILLRRLRDNFPLGVDSTIQYYLGYSNTEMTWWRQMIYQSDLDNNNDYNTRLNPGLPPTPICNPGEDSINAILNPTPNDYYYYISDKNGIIHYATTIDQQNENIAKYLD